MTAKTDAEQGIEQNKAGLTFYETWDIDKAIIAFTQAIKADLANPEYHLNLARAYARGGDYQQAMKTLGLYLQYEADETIAARFETLFSLALDEVETVLIETARKMNLPIQQIGKAIQMWLEYRISIGRRVLRTPKPALWAAAITYAILKVNLEEVNRERITAAYDVNERSLREKYREVVQTLDLMPADYRYFTGETNPLDKLVEAAQMLEELDRKFQEY